MSSDAMSSSSVDRRRGVQTFQKYSHIYPLVTFLLTSMSLRHLYTISTTLSNISHIYPHIFIFWLSKTIITLVFCLIDNYSQ